MCHLPGRYRLSKSVDYYMTFYWCYAIESRNAFQEKFLSLMWLILGAIWHQRTICMSIRIVRKNIRFMRIPESHLWPKNLLVSFLCRLYKRNFLTRSTQLNGNYLLVIECWNETRAEKSDWESLLCASTSRRVNWRIPSFRGKSEITRLSNKSLPVLSIRNCASPRKVKTGYIAPNRLVHFFVLELGHGW